MFLSFHFTFQGLFVAQRNFLTNTRFLNILFLNTKGIRRKKYSQNLAHCMCSCSVIFYSPRKEVGYVKLKANGWSVLLHFLVSEVES